MSLEERQERHADFLKKKRKPIKKVEIKKLIRPVKEGKVWVIRDKGTELRNPNKQECLNDWATINGYEVK